MYASIFGNMVAIVQRLSSRAARFHTEMNIIKEFLRCYKIPDELRRSVQTYFRQEWSVSEGVDAQSVSKCNNLIVHMSRLRCLLSRENLNSTFSASYIQMAISFDLLDRFQENKVFQTAQAISNILKSNTKW